MSILYADIDDLQRVAQQLSEILEIDPRHRRAWELLKRIELE
jgi:hypothetical protein